MAKKHQQNGWVANENSGVRIWLEGRNSQQEQLLTDLQHQLPAFAHIEHLTSQTQALENFADFQIKSSHHQGDYSAFVLPDISPCPDCIAELFNPNSRFYHYPFISCCQCGPRYSIMQQQPYDRQHTTMADFQPCSTCWHDYHAPENRRFHAQTIACEHCGPQLQLLNPQGELLHSQHNALLEAVKHLQQGGIIALKGIGGFQLLADATQEEAVQRLRDRKNRPAKPFALMLKDMKSIKAICAVNAIEQQALRSSASPIVLLNHLANRLITQTVAPNNTQLGVMLPSSPLHHLLAYYFAKPLVVTSGNRSHEPLCTDKQQALDQLADIADFFLSHNRKITHGLDDSVVRNINNQVVNLRRARGYVPLPISIDKKLNVAIAVGGHSKNTIAISHGQQLILSQHLGDLNSLASQQYFQKTLTTLTDFYHTKPKIFIHDYHADYYSSQVAQQQNLPTISIQHHHAHILSCMAEHNLRPPVLGFAWDGTGLGADNSQWGGECLLLNNKLAQRFAHSLPFPLVGADKAAIEPRRAALGILYKIYGASLFTNPTLLSLLSAFSQQELTLLQPMLAKNINCSLTSSIGRLFDAASSLLGLCQINQFEGQAAMQLEQLASTVSTKESYPFELVSDSPILIDWQPLFMALIADLTTLNPQLIAAKFHRTLANIMLQIALHSQQKTIILSGGCFQNAYLTEHCIVQLESAGLQVYSHKKIPPNDGGLALGQLYSQAL